MEGNFDQDLKKDKFFVDFLSLSYVSSHASLIKRTHYKKRNAG